MSVVDPGQVKLAIEKEGQLPLLTRFDQVSCNKLLSWIRVTRVIIRLLLIFQFNNSFMHIIVTVTEQKLCPKISYSLHIESTTGGNYQGCLC